MNHRPPTSNTSNVTTLTSVSAAAVGRRFAHFQPRSAQPAGRARIGSPRRNRPSSSANAAAVAYRLPGSLCRHFRQIVSRSRGVFGCNCDGGTGSSATTCIIVSSGVAARNGGRPVSSSYRIAPRA